MHIYHLPSSALKYDRHTSALNLTFLLLSTDYSKSIHLQTDRSIEFHTPMGCHYTTRIPRYGRGLAYLKPTATAVIPAEGNEVFRLDLEAGRFLKPFELGGYADVSSAECVGVADGSHGLIAFGTDLGTTEFWDPRSRNRVGVLAPPQNSGVIAVPDVFGEVDDSPPAITSATFHPGGLTLATGNAAGMVTLYDLRSPAPLLSKDQGYGFPIQSIHFLHATQGGVHEATSTPKVMSADKRIIKIWEQSDGRPWTSIEPSVDINHVCPVPNSGMIFTANEGKEMHSFLIPALGPSPSWCAHLDTQIEQLADRRTLDDPDAYGADTGAVTYDNYKFLTKQELRSLNLDHLLTSGKGGAVIRPYMHGYFVDQRLYDEARVITDPFEWERERKKLIKEKIEKQRESRIRTATGKQENVKVNQRLAERLERLEGKLGKKLAKDAAAAEAAGEDADAQPKASKAGGITADPRFAGLFEKPEFVVDETSREFQLHNPSTVPDAPSKRARTAAESEDEASSRPGSSDSDSESESEEEKAPPPPPKKKETKKPEMRISSSSYKKSGHDTRGFDRVSNTQKARARKEKTFGARVAAETATEPVARKKSRGGAVIGDREITFTVPKKKPGGDREGADSGAGAENRNSGGGKRKRDDRRSASGNVFRKQGVR